MLLDHSTYFCLVICTIAEPVFFKKASKCLRCRKSKPLRPSKPRRSTSPSKKTEPFLLSKQNTLERNNLNINSAKRGEESDGEDKSVSMIFHQESQRIGSDSDDDFENGDNKKEGTELSIVENQELDEEALAEAYANFND